MRKIPAALNTPEKARAIYILIPAMYEQSIIEESIAKFFRLSDASFDMHVVIATTVREEGGETEKVVRTSMDSGILSAHKERIHIICDPYLRGNMATQLNYALEKISTIAPPETFYLIYNADSIISVRTFEQLSELIGERPGKNFAFQQPTAFVKDMAPSSVKFLNALSLYQTWYCLGIESQIIRAYSKKSAGPWPRKKRLGVIIGHGSGMTLGLNRINGGYPGNLLTEDLTFGFILSANDAPIFSLPALELADVPGRFSSFIKQKSIWFWNYLSYFACYKKMRSRGLSTAGLLSLLSQGLGAGSYWFFSAIFIMLPLVYGFVLASPLIILISLASILLCNILPHYLLFRLLPGVLRYQGFSEEAENVSKVSFMSITLPLLLIFITDSIGPWIASVRAILSLFTGKLPPKYKTDD